MVDQILTIWLTKFGWPTFDLIKWVQLSPFTIENNQLGIWWGLSITKPLLTSVRRRFIDNVITNRSQFLKSISPWTRFVKLTIARNLKMNTRARTTRDMQGQVGQRTKREPENKNELNKAPLASKTRMLPKVIIWYN